MLNKRGVDRVCSYDFASCTDLTAQNSLLHQHLESVTSQAARIRQTADSTSTSVAGSDGTEDTEARVADLQSIVSYLRKEKEIVDLQLDLSKGECARLKSHLQHAEQSLNEVRNQLSEVRRPGARTTG
jgi:nucleoprotein TPR